MGKILGLTVLAEGAETEQQMFGLKALGCHEARGFYFSRPVDRDTLINSYFKADKSHPDRAN